MRLSPLHVVIKECMHLVLLYSTVCDGECMSECTVLWSECTILWCVLVGLGLVTKWDGGAVLIALSECSVLGRPVDRTWIPEVIAASY